MAVVQEADDPPFPIGALSAGLDRPVAADRGCGTASCDSAMGDSIRERKMNK
jgi:hypothetical protein